MTTTQVLALFIFVVVIGVRVFLWSRFRDDRRGTRLAVSTAQLIVVALAVVAYDSFGSTHSIAITALALVAIVGLSFMPIRKSPTAR